MRRRGDAHNEAIPTRRLVLTQAAKSICIAVLIGCCTTLVLVAVTMLVAAAVVPEPLRGATDRLGLGIVAASAIGILALALLCGAVTTVARLSLTAFYRDRDPMSGEIRDTLRVRGQASPTPYDPAMASVVALGSLSLLAAVVCIVLASEHAGRLDDELHRSTFEQWALWGGLFLAVTAACGVATWAFSRLNRRWVAVAGTRLPAGTVGERGPSARITTRAERRIERRSWRAAEWADCSGRVAVVLGAGLVFLGVYLRQPGLYADPVSYEPAVERVIDTGTGVGGALLTIGLLVVLCTSALAFGQTVRALRQPRTSVTPISAEHRARVRTATTTLSNTTDAALIWWTVFGVVAIGWWFADHVLAPAGDGATILPVSPTATAALTLGWVLVGLLLIGARVALERVGPTIRNRFGYRLPSEADEREFPDIQLFGQ